MIGFYLKKIISSFLLPVPLVILILLAGVFFLRFGGRQRLGRILVSLGALLLLFFSNQAFPNYLLRSMEGHYRPLRDPAPGVQWIVVLGGGYRCDTELPIANQLRESSLCRVIEGVRLHREHPGSRLFMPGPSSEAMARFAVFSGTARENIVVQPGPRDTADEAEAARKLVGDAPCILVTSALHLPRALELFRRQGMHPVPAPAEYIVNINDCEKPGFNAPGLAGLRKSTLVVYELLGLAWIHISGK